MREVYVGAGSVDGLIRYTDEDILVGLYHISDDEQRVELYANNPYKVFDPLRSQRKVERAPPCSHVVLYHQGVISNKSPVTSDFSVNQTGFFLGKVVVPVCGLVQVRGLLDELVELNEGFELNLARLSCQIHEEARYFRPLCEMTPKPSLKVKRVGRKKRGRRAV